jgi:hypothetical protein
MTKRSRDFPTHSRLCARLTRKTSRHANTLWRGPKEGSSRISGETACGQAVVGHFLSIDFGTESSTIGQDATVVSLLWTSAGMVPPFKRREALTHQFILGLEPSSNAAAAAA